MRLGVLALLAATLLTPAYAQAITLPDGFSEELVASNLVEPIDFEFLPDGRMLIAQKNGLIRIMKNGVVQSTPFIDLRQPVNDHGDRGVMAITADPDFEDNGYVYLYYSFENDPQEPRLAKTNRLTRVTATGDTASRSSEVVLLGTEGGSAQKRSCNNFPVGTDCLPSDFYSHIGGNIKFASDGTLFLATGDAASPHGVQQNALRSQQLDSLAGKLIRVTKTGAGLPSNPFWTGDADDNRSKVWAYGLRNPFRFALKPGSDAPFIGDVGWLTWEELDVPQAGANLGWPCYEANSRAGGYDLEQPCKNLYAQGPSAVQAPLHAYDHDVGATVIGGTFYTDTAFPTAYRGAFFFGDYEASWIRTLRVDADNKLVPGSIQTFATEADGPITIEMGPDGNLYYISINTNEIRRIRFTAGNKVPFATTAADPTSGQAPLTVQFSSAGSSDPDGDPLGFNWDFGDGSTSTEANPTHTYEADGAYTATLTVDDGRGGTDSASVSVSVGNPPTATIELPTPSFTYKVGDTVTFSGSATDVEDDPFPASGLSWRVIQLHCPDDHCHVHPITTAEGESGSFVVDDHGDDTFFSIILTATDSDGHTDSTSIDIHPQLVDITLDTNPSGLQMVYDGITVTGPFTRATPAGSTHTIGAPSPQGNQEFEVWSDGGAQQHDVTLGESDASYTATFSTAAQPPSDVYDAVVKDSSCTGCSFLSVPPGYEATIAGGNNSRDTAYGRRELGGGSGLSGRIYARTVLRLAQGETLGGNLPAFQVLDTNNKLVYQLVITSSRQLRFTSPAGGLRSSSITVNSGKLVPNNGSTWMRVEVSALRNDSATLRIDGVNVRTLGGLSGATTTNPRNLLAGIITYGGTTTNEQVKLRHAGVNVSTSDWLGPFDTSGGLDTTPPGAPTSFAAVLGASQVDLSWQNPSDSDLDHVRIVRKAGSAPQSPSDGTVVCDCTGTQASDSLPADGVTYHYAAYAVDESDNVSQPARASVTGSGGGPPPPTGGDDVYDAVVTDSGCAGCSFLSVSPGYEATIAGGENSRDTAYGRRELGGGSGLSGRIYTRTVLRLPQGETLGDNLPVFQVLDTNNALVFQLVLTSSREVRFTSPAGGLRSTSIIINSGKIVPNNGSTWMRVEVSALRNDSAVLRIDGVNVKTLSGFTGATTTNPRNLLAGIITYGTTTTNEQVQLRHAGVNVNTSDWLGQGPVGP